MAFSYYFKRFIGIQRRKLKVIKLMGKLKTGKLVFFGKQTDISVSSNGEIEIGNHSSVGQFSCIASVGGMICIGKKTFINSYADIVSHIEIKIGDNCAIGPKVTIYDHDHKFSNKGIIKGFNKTGITIGDNCWIGANVTILRGTEIGNNCVIGAGCVVKGKIPNNTLVIQSRELILKPLV